MSDHALLAPSSMGIVMVCAGSVQLARLYPEDNDSQDAREGTASHWAGQEMLEGRLVDVGQIAPNGVILDEDMIEGAEMYHDAVRETVPTGGQVEQRVDCSNVHPFMWGTPDFWYYDAVLNILYVFDYKYGRRFVEVFENWQLIAYVAGIIRGLRAERAHWQHAAVDRLIDTMTVQMTIVQPRSYHRDGPVRSWRTSAAVLQVYSAHLAAGAEAAVLRDGTYNPDALCVVNPGCLDCTGRRACPTLQRAGMAGVDLSEAPVPFDLPPAAVGVELRMIQHAMLLLKARASGLEEQARAAMMAGQDVPFFRLERPQGREKWGKPVTEVLALGSLLGLNLAKPPAAITPTQARKLGLPAELTATYAFRSTGEMELVPDDGKKARKVFSQ
jgi:hypothetical protein